MTYGRSTPRPGPKCLIVNDLRTRYLKNSVPKFAHGRLCCEFDEPRTLTFGLRTEQVVDTALALVAVVNFRLRILLFCFISKDNIPHPLRDGGVVCSPRLLPRSPPVPFQEPWR